MIEFLHTILPAVGALAAVLALVLLAGRVARLSGFARIGGQGGDRRKTSRLVVQDTLALDRARRLHVVRCDGKDVVLLTGGTTDLVVGWLSGQGESA